MKKLVSYASERRGLTVGLSTYELYFSLDLYLPGLVNEVFSLSNDLSMHIVLNIPPTWVLVWSSGAEKSLLCRPDPLLHLMDCSQSFCRAYLLQKGQDLACSRRTQVGKQLCWCKATMASLSSLLRAWQKGLDASRTPDCEMILLVVAFSLLRPQQFFSATNSFSSFFPKPLWKLSQSYIPLFPCLASISLQKCLVQTASFGLQPMNPPTLWCKCNH